MLTALCVVVIALSWGFGLYTIGKGLGHEPPEKFEELAPSYDTVTLNTDLEGMH